MSSDMIFSIERALDKMTDDQIDRIVREMDEEQEELDLRAYEAAIEEENREIDDYWEAIDRQAYEEAMERSDILEAIEDSMRFSDDDLIESCGLPVG